MLFKLAVVQIICIQIVISNSLVNYTSLEKRPDTQWNSSCTVEKRFGNGGKLKIICDTPNILFNLPPYPAAISEKVSLLSIINQPRLETLSSVDLTPYPLLAELYITHTGLSYISPATFSKNRYLKKVSLRSNALRTLDWRSVVNLRDAVLNIGENPFVCNCSMFWLAAWTTDLTNKRVFSAPDGREFFVSTADAMTLPKEILHSGALSCTRNGSQEPVRLSEWRYTASRSESCTLPAVEMKPKSIRKDGLAEASMVQFQCTVNSSQALDFEFRQTFQMKVVDVPDTRNRMAVTKRTSGPESASFELLLKNVTKGQTGWYICIGLSASGPNFDMSALVVESEPRIRLVNQNRTRQIDYFVDTYDFTIFAYPSPTNFTWFKNNSTLNFADQANKLAFSVMDEESWLVRGKGFFYVSRLTFMVKLRYKPAFFEGDYALEACNRLGCDRLDFVSYNAANLPTNIDRWNETQNGNIAPSIMTAESRGFGEQGWIIAVTLMSVGMLFFGTGMIFCYLRRKNQSVINHNGRRWMRTDLGARGPSARRLIRNGHEAAATSVQLSSYTSNAIYEPLLSASVPLIPRESLEITRPLGEGAFGQVRLAYCKLNFDTSGSVPKQERQQSFSGSTSAASNGNDSATSERSLVAAKILKKFTLDRSQEVAREAELMVKLKHPNIVAFYGVCVQDSDDLLLLYEYMELGDLRHFLALHGPNPELATDDYETMSAADMWRLNDTQLIDIALQVAKGLAYLHENHFVHRDLACRNCLVKAPLVVKLSDFGMTRDIYSSDYYRLTHKAPLPVRWLPPESLLYGRFSELSDIWSYGVVVWEITAYGKLPWCQHSNVDVMQRVNSGETLEPPAECHPILRQVMLDCWKRTPSERVKLNAILTRLSSVT